MGHFAFLCKKTPHRLKVMLLAKTFHEVKAMYFQKNAYLHVFNPLDQTAAFTSTVNSSVADLGA